MDKLKFILTFSLLLIQILEAKKFGSKNKEKLSLLTDKKPVVKLTPKVKPSSKVMTEDSMMEEDFQERERICKAIQGESLQDFFVKFGLVTKLISDVGSFKDQMKRSFSTQGWERKKRYRLEGGEDKYFLKSKVGMKVRPLKHNYLINSEKGRSDPGYMPPCYGFNYLTAIDALLENDDGRLGPDMDVVEELMAEMFDRELSSEIIDVFNQCDKSNEEHKYACPVVDTMAALKEKKKKNVRCPDNCTSDSQCASKEMCCANSCGGMTCYNPRLASKYRSEEQKLALTKCQDADKFFQCVYSAIKKLDKC